MMKKIKLGRYGIKLTCGHGYYAWYITPSVRVGFYESGGGFFGCAFLKFDVCVSWERKAALI